MRTFVSVDDWPRWSVTAVGVFLCGAIVGTIGIIQLELTALHQLQLGFPALLALGLVAYGGWLARGELPSQRITRIALWSLAGAVIIGLTATWEMYLHLFEGEAFLEGVHELFNGLMKGAVVGGLVGYYDVRQREQHRETKRVKRAISASIDGIAILDEDGRYTQVNQAHADVYGYESSEDFIGESWRMCYTDNQIAGFEEQVLPILETEGRWRGESTGKRRDGSSFPQEVTLTALDDGGLVCVVRDISERRAQERELEWKTELLETTQRMATVGGWELDLRDDDLRWTDEMHRIYELPLDYEPTLESALEFFHPEDTHRLEEAIERAIEDGESYDIELRLITAEDDLRWTRALGEPRRERGETILLRGTFQDITERKRAEDRIAALHEGSRELMYVTTSEGVASATVEIADQVLDKPLSVMWFYDEETDRLEPSATADSSEEFLDAAGITEPPPLGEDHVAMDVFREGELAVIEDYSSFEQSTYTNLPLGTVFIVPIGNHGILLLGTKSVDEVTETDRHQINILALNAGAALDRVQREQYLSRLIDNLPGVVYRAANEPEWPVEFVRGICRELTGYDSFTIQDGAVTFGEDIIHPDDQQAVWETVQDALDAGERFEIEYRIRTKDGAVKWVWEQGTGVYDERGQLVALEGFITDITDQKEFTETMETLHIATREMVEMEGTERVCQTAVDAADQLLDLPITGIWLSDDTGRRLDPVAWTDEAESVIDEFPVYTAEEESLSWQAFESGETRVYDDLRTEASPANTETPIRSEIVVSLGEYGVMNIGSETDHSFDETDVRAAELLGANTATALERVEQRQKLETQLDRMEFFNSILRHDVLNGMTIIQGRAEFLTDELDGDQLRDAETILRWSDDTTEIVQRVRKTLDTLTDRSDIQLEPVDLPATLREELDRVRETYPEVTFETTIPDSVAVQANELLGEVLGNVVTNAVHHNNAEGLRISITASEEQEDDTLVVRIADNGKGVPDEAKETIFRRDATGHAKSSGSGFGLFFVDTMVESYGGNVWVEDNERGGATFVIELPLAEATAPA